MKKLMALVFAMAGLCVPSARADVTVGTFGGGYCLPLMCNYSGADAGLTIDYQQVYAAAAFSSPMTFTSMTFYYDAQDGGSPMTLGGQYDFYWGYARFNSVGNLSTDLAANYISARTFLGSTTIPAGGINSDPSITFSGFSFTYDPSQGNLLLEIVATGQDDVCNGCGNGYNQGDYSGTVTSSAYCIPNFTCGLSFIGNVTTFGTAAPVPEAGTLLVLSGVGIGVLRWKFRRG